MIVAAYELGIDQVATEIDLNTIQHIGQKWINQFPRVGKYGQLVWGYLSGVCELDDSLARSM